MAHHGDKPFPSDLKELLKPALGATGKFPEGKLTEDDEGEIHMGVIVKDNKVILAFGKPVAWVGMTRVQAINLADLLKRRAMEL